MIDNTRILLVDDDPEYSEYIRTALEVKGLTVDLVKDSKALSHYFEDQKPDLVLLDVNLKNESGLDLIESVKTHDDIPVIMASSRNDVSIVVQAMRLGADDYVVKPIDIEILIQKIKSIAAKPESEIEFKKFDAVLNQGIIVGESKKSKQLLSEISKLANSNATIFLRGESGTGKSHIAKLIHEFSERNHHPFVTVNCAAIPGDLLESEFFGHVKGAFTGAIKDKVGKFEQANLGTIFLDEVGELPDQLQAKLLRVLQSHEYERVGGLKTIHADVRVIAATNKNIEQAIQDKTFREDLFYRLNVLPIIVPSLRERYEDVPLLIDYFFKMYCRKCNKKLKALSQNILSVLTDYSWPGNVRQLMNVIERAVILGTEPHLKLGDFSIPNTSFPSKKQESESINSVADVEKNAMLKALEQTAGNMTKTAEVLGIGRDTLYRKLKKYNIHTKTSKR